MVCERRRVNELIVGLGDVKVARSRCRRREVGAGSCASTLVEAAVVGVRRPVVESHGERVTELADLAGFRRAAKLVWHNRRWTIGERAAGIVIEQNQFFASLREGLSTPAGRWTTLPVRTPLGSTSFTDYCIRAFRYAGQPNWNCSTHSRLDM